MSESSRNPYGRRPAFASYLAKRIGNIMEAGKLRGRESVKVTEIYSRLSDKPLRVVMGQWPGPIVGAFLDTAVVLPGRGIVPVADKKAVGDRGLETLPSPGWRKDRSKRKRGGKEGKVLRK